MIGNGFHIRDVRRLASKKLTPGESLSTPDGLIVYKEHNGKLKIYGSASYTRQRPLVRSQFNGKRKLNHMRMAEVETDARHTPLDSSKAIANMSMVDTAIENTRVEGMMIHVEAGAFATQYEIRQG